MTEIKKTQVGVRSDSAIGIASSGYGANIDAVAFNLTLIASKRPTKAAEILNLFDELRTITPESVTQPDENFNLASERIRKSLDDTAS